MSRERNVFLSAVEACHKESGEQQDKSVGIESGERLTAQSSRYHRRLILSLLNILPLLAKLSLRAGDQANLPGVYARANT